MNITNDWIEQLHIKEHLDKQIKINYMTIKDYEEGVIKTARYPKKIGLLYCTLGLVGESGEVAEKVKKLYRDKDGLVSPQFRKDIVKELGDVMWYVTNTAKELGLTLEEVMQANLDKVQLRVKTNTIHGDGDNREEV